MFGRKVYILLAAVFLIALGAYLLMVPGGKDIPLIGIISGTDVIVSPQIPGRLARLLVDEGAEVRQGQLLAELDSTELQAQAASAEAAVNSMEARIAEAKHTWSWTKDQTEAGIQQALAAFNAAAAQLEEARAGLWKDRQNLKRVQELFDRGIASAQDRDLADAAVQASEARAKSLEDTVEAKKADLQAAQAGRKQMDVVQSQVVALEAQLAQARADAQQCSIRLGYTRIVAPINGVVTVRVARQGEMVAQGGAIVVVLDLDHLWVRADVEESFVDSIQIGDRLPVQLPSGARLEGTVFFKGAEGDFATQRDVSRSKRDIKTFAIKVAIPNTGHKLFTGMTATVILPRPGGAKRPSTGM